MSLLFTNSVVGEMIEKQQKRLDNEKIWVKIVDTDEVKDFIVFLNTEEQLFDKGIDSTGRTLKSIGGNDFTSSGYSPVTIEIKRRKGGKSGRISNITLYDTGDYYKSHKVKVSKNGFTISSDPQKDDTNLYAEWGEDIVGLTDESLQKLINLLIVKYIEYTRNVILAD